jgi:hypothetical protein
VCYSFAWPALVMNVGSIDRDGLGMFLRLVSVWMSLVVGLRSVASRVLDERLWGICFGDWVVMIPYLTYRYLGLLERKLSKRKRLAGPLG